MFWIKVIVSGLLIALSSTLARKYPGPAGIVVALPITTLISLAWMGVDGVKVNEMATFLQSVGWITFAGLGLFFITPALIRQGWQFWPAFGVGMLSLIAGSALVYRFVSCIK